MRFVRCFVAKRIGRPPIPENQRKRSISFSLGMGEITRISKLAQRQGVTRSQVVFDAIQAYTGELPETLGHLRAELADAQNSAQSMREDLEAAKEKLGRIESSHELADAILNPYKSPEGLTRSDKERARCLRAILNVPATRQEAHLLAIGELEKPTRPILGDAHAAFGSWEAVEHAVRKAEEKKE